MNLSKLKRWFVGTPIATAQAHHERLGPITGLAVFASDNLSSVAYATEEILRVLLLAGVGALAFSVPIGLCIGAVIGIVILSYRQNIAAYPQGASDYIVAKDNLGVFPGLTAGAALLIDYTLTVAVSVSAGVAALTSAFPALYPYRVVLGIALVVLVAVANLRGIRESGRVFAVWSYLFIGGYALLMVYGFTALAIWGRPPGEAAPPPPPPVAELGLFLLLRAFASGAVALTGIEAVSDGTPAFRPPEVRNAQTVLAVLGVIMITLFVGITVLAAGHDIVPHDEETVVSQLARQVFGGGLLYYFIQGISMVILALAANTAFADFPRLASFMARDGYLPRQFASRGDRLVFSNGVIILGLAASGLIALFHGSTHLLIPLYALGVFTSFTLSQVGMVRRWITRRPAGWRPKALISGLGATTTGLVMVVTALAKFSDGAWIVVVIAVRSHRGLREHQPTLSRGRRPALARRLRGPASHAAHRARPGRRPPQGDRAGAAVRAHAVAVGQGGLRGDGSGEDAPARGEVGQVGLRRAARGARRHPIGCCCRRCSSTWTISSPSARTTW